MSDAPARPAPQKPRRRPLRRALGWLVLLFLVGCGLGLYFRLDLINRLAPGLLAQRLAVPTEFALSLLDWREARIDRIRLGEKGTLAVEGITLGYDPWNRRLERVEIDRVVLAARYDEGFSLGELDPLVAELRTLLSAGGGDSGDPAALPTVDVKSIEIDLASPAGLLQGRGQAALDNQAVVADFTLSETGKHAEAEIDLALSLAADGPPPSGDLRLGLDAQSALWKYLRLQQPGSGRIDLEAEIRAGRDWQKLGRIDADWRATLVDFAYPGLAAPLAGEVRATSTIARDKATIKDLAIVTTGGIGEDWLSKLVGNFELGLAAPLSLNGRLTLESGGKTLALAPLGGGDITLAAPQATIIADVAVAQGGDGAWNVDLGLLEPAALSLKRVEIGKSLRIAPAGKLEILAGETPFLHLTRDAAGRIVADVTATLGKGSITIEPRASDERLILAMPKLPLQLSYDAARPAPLTAKIGLKGGQVAAPLHGITLGDVAFDAAYADDAVTAKLASGAVGGLGAFVPVRAEANVTLAGNDIRFDARFRGVDRPIDLTLKGRADIARLSGKVDLELKPIVFATGELQPYNLFPPLRSYFDDVAGKIEAKGPISFGGGKLTSALKLGIENFSGKIGPVQLLNVNSVIEIDRPWPLSTKPDQQVAIQRADIGLPLTDALFRFKVSDGKRLDVAESRLAMSGGEVRMEPVSLVFDAPVHNLKLTVAQVSVNELFAALGVAGLTGEGSISGAVPVSIFPGGIAIPAAELKADAPGVLRYDRAQAPAALQSAGESVGMALEALSNFHYKELILKLTRQLTGDVNLGLHISGANPNFYDGYPVEFNLSVEGRLDEALREGLAGYQVPDMIQEQLENLAP